MAAMLRLLVTMVSLMLRVLIRLRLGIPLLYTILMITAFSSWAAAHNTLAIGILIALVVSVGISWLVTLVRKVKTV
ncbi:hypothetical protein LJC64_01195 [Ruminococcaceae bacterium OttesenSCG-928-A11]|nr:hypothetical protein [Ruminococcaceae bacterium OttesenSCG-928-A11]